MDTALLKRILSFTGPYRAHLFTAVASAVISVALTLYCPVLIGRAIDLIVGPRRVDFAGMLPILGLLAASILLSALFQWLLSYCTNTVTHRTVRDMRVAAFGSLSRTPLGYIDRQAHGDLISRVVNDIDQVSDGLLQGFSQLFTGVVTILGTLCFMLSINVGITAVVVVLTPLSLFVASFIARHSFEMFRAQSQARGDLGGYVEEMVGNQKLVKAFCQEGENQKRFEEINGRLYACGVKAQFYSSLTNPCTRFVNGVVYAAVGIIGAVSAVQGRISVGQLSCFLSYANQYTKPFNEITGVVTELQSALASARRVFAVIDEPPEPPEPAGARVLTGCDGRVELKDVSFSYRAGQRLIENLSLAVGEGRRIAIVGPTGCGKTTLINLLMRFYDVTGGAVLVSGTDVRDITRDSLRKSWGMVLQDSWLFHGTVRENIAYGSPGASPAQVEEAARSAHAHSFIKRLPQGYDTVIAEDGGNLSQGQRQLLCIARVLLTLPPMLILDEATSSIDTRTEIRIQKAFAKMMEGRTSFVVAHRLSTIQEADRILVMEAGRVVEQGTHQELLAQGGFYHRLYHSQFAVEE